MKITVDLTEEEQFCVEKANCIGCDKKGMCIEVGYIADRIAMKMRDAIQQAKTAIREGGEDTRC